MIMFNANIIFLCRCRKADSARKQHQLQTGDGPQVEVKKDEDLNEIVRFIVPTIDFTLENPWDNTAKLESSNHFYVSFT